MPCHTLPVSSVSRGIGREKGPDLNFFSFFPLVTTRLPMLTLIETTHHCGHELAPQRIFRTQRAP